MQKINYGKKWLKNQVVLVVPAQKKAVRAGHLQFFNFIFLLRKNSI